jgi:hypothetical protein
MRMPLIRSFWNFYKMVKAPFISWDGTCDMAPRMGINRASSSIQAGHRSGDAVLVQGQGMSQTTVVVSGQNPARDGEEMARRRPSAGYNYPPPPPGYFLPPRSYAPQWGYTW